MAQPEQFEILLANLPYWKLRDAILAHPTMAEGLRPLFTNVRPRSAQRVTPEGALLPA
jgi:hypothetical protein